MLNGACCSTEFLNMKKLRYVVTIPAVVHTFLRAHILEAAQKYEVTVICNSMDRYLLDGLKARVVALPIDCHLSPWRDLRVLFQLFSLFRHERFDIVRSYMPNTELLGMLSAWLAGAPISIEAAHQVFLTCVTSRHR